MIRADLLSKSDPFVVVKRNDLHSDNRWVEVGRTEVIADNEDPVFVKVFSLDYYFEENQQLEFGVWDSDDHRSTDVSKSDFLGKATMSLGDIVSARGVS